MQKHEHNDLCTCKEQIKVNGTAGYDPTRTTALRNAFASQMNRRFDALASLVYKAIVIQDCFGMKTLSVNQVGLPGERAFAFATSQEKVEAFMRWLQEQVDAGVLQLRYAQQIGSALNYQWTNLYIEDSYKRGIARARYEMQQAGYEVPSIWDTGGVGAAMGTPFHLDRVGLLYTRTFTDLVGVTDAMSSQISRVLAQGMIDGDGMRLIARKLLNVITGSGGNLGLTDTLGRFINAKRRAEMIARTEIIRAHHIATIQEYRNWRVVGVRVRAEWTTAGDDRVCSRCSSMEGKTFTLEEAEPLLPAHPNCRCIMLPAIIEGGN
jgi:SPP1 gp7 family putative phage head morphogenesis protein